RPDENGRYRESVPDHAVLEPPDLIAASFGGFDMEAMLSTRALTCQTAEAQDDRLHLHAVAARRDRDAPAVLASQRELQPLHPVEPRPVAARPPSRRGSHPVVPLPGEPLREQHAATDGDVRER